MRKISGKVGFRRGVIFLISKFYHESIWLKTGQVVIVLLQDLLQSSIKLRPFGMIWLEGKHLSRALVEHLDKDPGMGKRLIETADVFGNFSKILV